MKNLLTRSFLLGACVSAFVSGCSITNMLTDHIMKADTNNDNVVSWAEFKAEALNDPDTAAVAKEKKLSVQEYIRNSFNEFDLNKDNKITRAELKKLME